MPEREGGKRVLEKVSRMGKVVTRLYLIWVDGGYRGPAFITWAMDSFRWVIQVWSLDKIKKHSTGSALEQDIDVKNATYDICLNSSQVVLRPKQVKGFVLLKKQ